MPKFLTPLDVREVSDSIWEIADSPFEYQSDLVKETIVVPVGFYTDFASVPRWLPIIYAMIGDEAHEAATIHDWLYYSAITTRDIADKVLREAILLCGMPKWKAEAFYYGVRVGGWKAWDEHRKAGHPEAGKFKDSPNISQK